MIYIIRRVSDDKQILKECLQSVMKQSNVKRILFLFSDNSIALNRGEWYAIIESDVCLSKNWIENMWKYHQIGDIIMGRAVAHPVIRYYKYRTTKIQKPKSKYLQNAIWSVGGYISLSEFNDDGARWVEGPVIEYHCPSYKHNPYIQGMMECVSINRIFKTIFGGIRLSIRECHYIFAKNAIMRGIGMLVRRFLW